MKWNSEILVDALTHKVLFLLLRLLILIVFLIEVNIAELIDILVEAHDNFVLFLFSLVFDRLLLLRVRR